MSLARIYSVGIIGAVFNRICSHERFWLDTERRVWRRVRMSDTNFVAVAKLDDVPPGKTLVVEAGGKSIVLVNSRDQIFAVINRCSHAEEPLACGRARNGWIACPVHGARFDLETGAVMNPPATQPIKTFTVRVVGDTIEVAV
jgi:3-phenylpropionate/trans-cinnamate dioxygenase ferredoxin subunit